MVWGQPPAYSKEAMEPSDAVLRLGSKSPRKSPDKETDLSDYYRRQGIDPEPIVGKIEEDCEHCDHCG